MTREKFVDIVRNELQSYGDCYLADRIIAAADKYAEGRTSWIPVSERLPKVADCYTVTRKIGSDLIVDTCFFDGIGNWYNGNQINRERNCLTNIVAWMPLPKPYEPKESEEKK